MAPTTSGCTWSGVHGIALAAYRGERPILSGAGLTPPKGLTALVEIANSTAVTVSGLELTGYRTSTLNARAGRRLHPRP